MSVSPDACNPKGVPNRKKRGKNPQPTGSLLNEVGSSAQINDSQQTQELNSVLQVCASIPIALQAQTDAIQALAHMFKQTYRDDDLDEVVSEDGQVGLDDESDLAEDILADLRDDVDVDPEGVVPDFMTKCLNETQGEHEYGKSLTEKVSESFGRIPSQTVSESVLDRLKKDYRVPGNCKLLSVPKVNTLMWAKLDKIPRATDVKLQHLQLSVTRGLVANSRIAESLYNNASKIPRPFFNELMRLTMDSSTAMGMAFRDINARRKAAIKSSIKDDVAGICDAKTVPGEWLFGDNVEQDVRVVKAVGKIMKPKMFLRPGFKPYNKNFTRPHNKFTGSNNLNFKGPARAVRKAFQSNQKQVGPCSAPVVQQ
ncbi:unnamed protein product [Allacma fusca]|uniref:Uncharacterized protein n=1 Tax=Allacma fusca TaxID=39272 RepID=A0A8J2KMC9_9HEXA|nr:unnamed protein product [Allacma fusca]